MRERMGNAARDIAERNRGATARSLNRIASIIAGDRGGGVQAGARNLNPAGRGEKGSAA
jgi:hypothetical protein